MIRIAAGATLYTGTATPEGAVTGSVGDVFCRTDGGTGTTLYIKQSGAGTNTGWVAVTTTIPALDYKLKNTVADTTPGYLTDKLKAGANIGLTTENPAGNEDTLVALSDTPALSSSGVLYFGASGTDGTWRLTRSGNDLIFSRRESGAYVQKAAITAA